MLSASPARSDRPALTDAERAQIKALHADGHGCREIAATLGRNPGTVSRAAKIMGLEFPGNVRVIAATQSLQEQARARRARLALQLVEEGERLLQELRKPSTVYAFAGRDGLYNEHTMEEPPPGDKLKLMQAATLALTKSMQLEDHDADSGAKVIGSLLGNMMQGLQAKYGTGDDSGTIGA